MVHIRLSINYSMNKRLLIAKRLLKEDGVMIIEDIQNFDYCEQFKMYVPVEFHDCIRIYDLRGINNQYDDVLFVIDKALKPEPLVP